MTAVAADHAAHNSAGRTLMLRTANASMGERATTNAANTTGRSDDGRCRVAIAPPTSTMASVIIRNDHVMPTGISSLRWRTRSRRYAVAACHITSS
ncbi:Uncharacterised protein [Mycobacterium tuberculosis]|nr:Uncharacterised protein [Mycobacterium tuberculosis]